MAILAALFLAAALAACGAEETPTPAKQGGESSTPARSPGSEGSQTPEPTPSPIRMPSPTPSQRCARRSGENGWPVDVGSDPAFCVAWLPASGNPAGYRVVLAYADPPRAFEYTLAAGTREFTVPPGEAPAYQPPPQTRCFTTGGFRVTVFAGASMGDQLLGGVDVSDGCLVAQFSATGCVAPRGKSDISLGGIDLNSPPSRTGNPPFLGCIAWEDGVSGETGFRVTLEYSGGERFVHDVPGNTFELIVPEHERPRGDLRERWLAGRNDFTITVTALFGDREQILTSTSVIVG